MKPQKRSPGSPPASYAIERPGQILRPGHGSHFSCAFVKSRLSIVLRWGCDLIVRLRSSPFCFSLGERQQPRPACPTGPAKPRFPPHSSRLSRTPRVPGKTTGPHAARCRGQLGLSNARSGPTAQWNKVLGRPTFILDVRGGLSRAHTGRVRAETGQEHSPSGHPTPQDGDLANAAVFASVTSGRRRPLRCWSPSTREPTILLV